MNPQDSNLPPEIPPVPPPRHGGHSESGHSEPGADQGRVDFGSSSSSGEVVPPDSVAPGPNRSDLTASDLAAAPGADRDRPDTAAPQPWTDSDRQAPQGPPPQRESVYTPRRQHPRSAAAPFRNPRPGLAPAEDVWSDADIPYQPKQLGVIDQLLLLLAEGATVWKKVLGWVRSQLPADLQRKLSDAMLTAIALGLLMLLLALWNPLGSGGGERAVASEPLPRTTVAESGPRDRFTEPTPEPADETAGSAAPVAAPEPTPEQSLIADIQDRVSRISRSYGAGLVQSVEVNLPENTLGVNVAEAWYGLPTAQQNEVAQDIYAQAQGLEFGTLQLRDPEGVVVARNPVVGPNMVVLRRLPPGNSP